MDDCDELEEEDNHNDDDDDKTDAGEVLDVLVVVRVLIFVVVQVMGVVPVVSERVSVSEADHNHVECEDVVPAIDGDEDATPVKGETRREFAVDHSVPVSVLANAAFVVKLLLRLIDPSVVTPVDFVLVTSVAENKVFVMVIVGKPFVP